VSSNRLLSCDFQLLDILLDSIVLISSVRNSDELFMED
jgi:hypothetical protein